MKINNLDKLTHQQFEGAKHRVLSIFSAQRKLNECANPFKRDEFQTRLDWAYDAHKRYQSRLKEQVAE